jgi:hypothetical protein
MSPLLVRALGLITLPVGGSASAFGGYALYLTAVGERSTGFSVGGVVFGSFLLGLGLPAAIASAVLLMTGRADGESLVPPVPLFVAGVLLAVTVLVLVGSALLDPANRHVNGTGAAILFALAVGFIKNSWRRGQTKRWRR